MNIPISNELKWIYNLADYKQMFDLTELDLTKKILDFPGGVSSFNADMFLLNRRVISGDEHYSLSQPEMEKYAWQQLQINENYLRQHTERLKSQDDAFIQQIFDTWRRNIQTFLNDYSLGIDQKRYQAMALPSFHFADLEFELALCRDLFFHTQMKQKHNHAYKPQDLITELCRVAHEVRVFPLQDESGEISKDLGPIIMLFQQNNFGVEVREVNYELQKGSNAMLRIWAKACVVGG